MHSVAIEHMAAADRQKDQFLELLATANLNKSRLLAAASHDLRRPLQTLAVLNGPLRRLARDPDIASAVAQQEQALNAVSRLLHALLDISKLESGAIKPEPTDFNIGPLFADLQRDFAELAATKGPDLQVEPSTQAVHSDRSLVYADGARGRENFSSLRARSALVASALVRASAPAVHVAAPPSLAVRDLLVP